MLGSVQMCAHVEKLGHDVITLSDPVHALKNLQRSHCNWNIFFHAADVIGGGLYCWLEVALLYYAGSQMDAVFVQDLRELLPQKVLHNKDRHSPQHCVSGNLCS